MILIYIYVFVLGTVIGSFLGVVIDRLPQGTSIVSGRSHCDACEHKLSPLELIPIVSYIVLRGRCRACHQKLSWRYPLVEALTGSAFVLCFYTFQFSLQTLIAFVLSAVLIIVSFIDYDTQIINDRFSVIIAALAVIQMMLNHSVANWTGLLVAVPLLLIALVTKGMGGGDIKLLAASGLLLGLTSTLTALFIAVILASIIGLIAMRLKKKTLQSAIPFGPFLAIGIYVAYLYGPALVALYLSFF